MFRILKWHLNRRGIGIGYWVVNNESDLKIFRELGGNAIYTD